MLRFVHNLESNRLIVHNERIMGKAHLGCHDPDKDLLGGGEDRNQAE